MHLHDWPLTDRLTWQHASVSGDGSCWFTCRRDSCGHDSCNGLLPALELELTRRDTTATVSRCSALGASNT